MTETNRLVQSPLTPGTGSATGMDGAVARHPALYVGQLPAEVDRYRGLGLPTRTLPQVLEVQRQIAAELHALRGRFGDDP